MYGDDARWQGYREINRARVVLKRLGRPDPAVLEEVDWTPSEYRLFQNWYYVDRERYTAEKIRTVTASIERPVREGLAVLQNPTLRDRLPLLAALSLALALWAPRKRLPMLLAVWIWIFLAGGVVQFQFSQFQERVALPAVLTTWLSSLLVCGIPAPGGSRSTRWKILAVATSVALLIGLMKAATEVRALVDGNRLSRANAHSLQQELRALERAGPQHIFVHWPPSLAWKNVSPYQLASRLPRPSLIELGWQVNSPPWLDHLAELGITDLGEAIATRSDVHLLCRAECGTERIRALESHLSERYGFEGRIVPRRHPRFPAVLSWQAVPRKAEFTAPAPRPDKTERTSRRDDQ